MLSRNNVKLGPRIASWSLPVVVTCPGASRECLKTCYARRGRLQFGNVTRSHERNRKLAESREFVSWMSAELRSQCVDVLRLHVAGDFYDNKYIRRWQRIIAANRQVRFFAYTRSWAVPDYRAALKRLAQEPNLQLWLSTDHSMPEPPRWPGCRTCYLMKTDLDQPPYPVDLAFRNRAKTLMKHTTNGSLVCPFENGVTTLTCSQCKLCWQPPRQESLRRVPQYHDATT